MGFHHFLAWLFFAVTFGVISGALKPGHNSESEPEAEPEPAPRGLIRDKVVEGMNKLFGKFGILECNGLEGFHKRGSFLQSIFKDVPTLGNFMCGPTCGGHCVPYSSFSEAPTSLSYAFGCQCPAQRCSPGPIVDNLADPSFKVSCARDDSCSCSGIGGRLIPHQGYLCNWVRIGEGDEEVNSPVTFDQVGGPDPTFSSQSRKGLPIKWCACCPRN